MRNVISILFLSGVVFAGSNMALAASNHPIPAKVPPVVQPAPAVVKLTPKNITYNDQNIPGDVAVTIQLDKLKAIQQEFETQVTEIKNKLQPRATEIQTALQKAVDAVKKDNGWGNDVNFNGQTNSWERTTPAK